METKIEGYNDLLKDTQTGAIISTNNAAYIAALKRSSNMDKQEQRIQQTNAEINNIKGELSDVKDMLKQLLEVVNNGR
jgi:DNA-binding transcriptional regulator GbsR (MarR family)